MALIGALTIGNWTILCVLHFFVNKDMFFTNLNTNLYHVRDGSINRIIGCLKITLINRVCLSSVYIMNHEPFGCFFTSYQ